MAPRIPVKHRVQTGARIVYRPSPVARSGAAGYPFPMSPLDPSTSGTPTPRSPDGRSYPEHLRPYERLDDQLLPLFVALAPATFDELSLAVGDARVRAALPRWIASAQWRGLVQRQDTTTRGPWAYGLGPEAASHLPHAA
jgi:hypothetical protein